MYQNQVILSEPPSREPTFLIVRFKLEIAGWRNNKYKTMKAKNSVIWTKLSAVLRRSAICAIALGAVLQATMALAQVQITGQLENFDVRYPNSLPNDLEVVIYGDFPTTPTCVISTWNTNTLLGGNGVQWGPASSITGPTLNNDPTSPAFGLDCIVIRWNGAPRPAMVGQMVHFGVHLRPGCIVHHHEVWWTINNQRILRPCDPHITWICTTRGWIIWVANPTPFPIYVYGPRFFAVAPAFPLLPNLNQLNFQMNPGAFGGTWANLQIPGGQLLYCIQPWCRIPFRITTTTWRPIIFQIGIRNVSDAQFPLVPAPDGGPNPNDFDGTNGTMMIMTTRATQEFREDVTGDGNVSIADFNAWRLRNGTASQDLTPTN